MLSIIKRLTAPAPEKFNDHDARLALSALLVRVARTDNQYAKVEAEEITRILIEKYALSHQQAEKLRIEAGKIEESAPDTVRFTRAIKDTVAYEERVGVVEALWRVVLSDGVRDHEEDGLMRLVANLLGVNDRENAHARQRVKARPK